MILPELPNHIEQVVLKWPQAAQRVYHHLRQIVFDTAASNSAVAPLNEDLKWGEPAFLTKTGTTLRIAWKAQHPDQIGLFVICHTDLLDQIRALYPQAFRYEGTRALYLTLASAIPEQAVAHLASRAQTYKL